MDYRKLIISFFAGEISDDEISQLKSWLELDPINRRIFNEENELWQESCFYNQIEHYKTHTAWNEISARLKLGNKRSGPLIIIGKNRYRTLLVAASVAFLVSIAGLGFGLIKSKAYQHISSATTFIATQEGEKSHIVLPDSTKIILNAGSTLQYNGNYNINSRNVSLTGEAFFEVQTNPDKPFRVQVNSMTITATGTSFNVLSYGDEDCIETTLKEGKIQVSVKGQKTITLKAGQQVVFFKKSEEIIVRNVDEDTYTSWKENKLRFHDTPFVEVMRKLSRNYNVQIDIVNPDLLDLTYTATFIDESIEEVMQMLTAVSPITYKIYTRTTINDLHYMKPRIVVDQKRNMMIRKPDSNFKSN